MARRKPRTKRASYYKRKAERSWDSYGKYLKKARSARRAAKKAEASWHRVRLTGR